MATRARMTMGRLRALADLMRVDPRAAGRTFLAEATEADCEVALQCALAFPAHECATFRAPVQIVCPRGRFWLAPTEWGRPLMPPAPCFAPEEFRRLGEAVRDALLELAA